MSQYTVSVVIVDQLFVCVCLSFFFLRGMIHLIQLVCGSSFFLSFSQEICEVESNSLSGSSFCFVLPLPCPDLTSKIFLFGLSQSLFVSVVEVSGLRENDTCVHPRGLVPVA